MLLKYNHTQKVGQRRRRVLNNGILRALETGMQLLQLRGLIPVGIPSNSSMKLEYGGPLMSPDEKLKQVTMISMLLKMGVPAEEVVPLLPFDPKDVSALEKAIFAQSNTAMQIYKQPENAALHSVVQHRQTD